MKFKSILASALALASTFAASADSPRYIFYFIGDGMGLGHVMTTESYYRDVMKSDSPLLMLQFPVTSVATTYSASSPVTDSAAAGTALSTGHKTKNGMLGRGPDTTAVQSIAVDLNKMGYGIGVVTTVCPDDATPGAFYAHVPNRSMYYEIGRDAAASGVSFLAGSNLRGLRDKDGKPTDLEEIISEAGISVVRGTDALKSVTSERVILLNTDSINGDVGYTVDSIAGVLTLPAMTEACLEHLQKNSPESFFMMVEEGSIDHCAHGNDAAGVVMETISFQDAIRIAYDFYLKHPAETLIVITADHDTGGMVLGSNSQPYNAHLNYLAYEKVSKDRFAEFCKSMLRSRRIFTWEDMREYLEENMGFWKHVPVSEEQTKALEEAFDRCFLKLQSGGQTTMYNTYNDFVVMVYRVMDDACGIGWTANSHAGNFVPVYAVGAGSEIFNGLNDNTEIPMKILKLAKGGK